MKKAGIVSLLVCAMALCAALAGCGAGSGASGGGNGASPNAAFVGTWDLIGLEQDGQSTSQEDLETLTALGLEVYLDLNEDGTAQLVLFGEGTDGTWDASSATEGTITIEGPAVPMTIEGEELKMEQDGASLTFVRGAKREAADEASSAAASDAAASSDAADAAGGSKSSAAE